MRIPSYPGFELREDPEVGPDRVRFVDASGNTLTIEEAYAFPERVSALTANRDTIAKLVLAATPPLGSA